jgi:trehalose/maltose transport system substrate-binding protein
MLKRFAVLLVIAALAMGLIPSVAAAPTKADVWCGTSDNVTITFITGSVGGEFNTSEKIVERFMADICPNITVLVVARPTSTTDTTAWYQQFFEAQSSDIDVYMIDVGTYGTSAENVVDLNEYLPEPPTRFFPGVLAAYNSQGRQVALPWFAGSGMLYYRTDLLDKYSLDVPQTWDELASTAKTIQDGERAEGNADFWGFVFQGNAYEGLTCDALEWQVSNGDGTILSPEGVIEVNNDPTIEIFDKVASWIGDFVPPEVVTFQEEDSRAVWQAGNAAFMRNWGYAWNLGQADDSVIKDKFLVGPLPGKEAGMSAATLGGWGLAVSKYSTQPEAAAALVNWLTDYDALKEYYLDRAETPVLPALYTDQDLLNAIPWLPFAADILNSATARPVAPAGKQYSQVSELYYTAVNNVLIGNTDAATAMADLELALADLGFTLP